MRATIIAHDDVNKEAACAYWSDLLSLSVEKLYRSNPKSSLGKVVKRKLVYGTCHIQTCQGSKEMYVKMMRWLEILGMN
ncbi:MAG TPA: hypothetical protein VI423_08100 [Paenisporosarcina sp.]|nr:hypothetical protein [Paenisporosarcina sp.]